MRAAGLFGVGVILLFALSPRKEESEVEFRTFPESESHLARLRDQVSELARELLGKALDSGLRLVVVQSFRSYMEQAELYAQGRTKPGKIVTNAKPGTSYHEYGLAFDVAVLGDNGKPSWPNDMTLWDKVGALGEELGLTWGGRFRGQQDYGHFQLAMDGIGPGKSKPPERPVS